MKQSPSAIWGESYSSEDNSFTIDKDNTEMAFFGNLDGANGDSFDPSYVFCELTYEGYAGLTSQEKPTNWSITKQNPQGTEVNEYKQQYTITFFLKAPPGLMQRKLDLEP